MTDTIQERLEYCVVCDQPTGHAGAGDGSIWCTKCEKGPLCGRCAVLGNDAWCVKCAADEIDRLRADVKFWNETAIEYKRQLNEMIRRGPESAGLHIITEEQINAAWELWSKYKDMGARAALAELGIKACSLCGGSGVEEYPPPIDGGRVCPTCRHKGWVMEER